MEDLTKHQIILLTLLVSFVTSIATGIVTVSLMDQAPPGVTQTINRVVERTIERVVPAENQAAVIKRETVVVRSDDLVVSALEKNSKSLVRIIKVEGSGETRTEKFAAIGVVTSKDGTIVTDSGVLSVKADETGAPIPTSFYAKFPDGQIAPLETKGVDSRGLALFAPVAVSPLKDNAKNTLVFTPATFGDSSEVKLGQAVVSLQGRDYDTTETGIISSLPPGAKSSQATTTDTLPPPPALFNTDIGDTKTTVGSVLLNLSGEIIGMKIGTAVPEDGAYLPANSIKKTIDEMVAAAKEKKN